jgi:hypothetical protein
MLTLGWMVGVLPIFLPTFISFLTPPGLCLGLWQMGLLTSEWRGLVWGLVRGLAWGLVRGLRSPLAGDLRWARWRTRDCRTAGADAFRSDLGEESILI